MLPAQIGGFTFGAYHDKINLGVRLVGTMAIALGIINILKVHGTRIIRQRKGWLNSNALILGLFAVLAIEAIGLVNSERELKAWQGISSLTEYLSRIENDHQQAPEKSADRVQAMLKYLEGLREAPRDPESPLFLNDPSDEETLLSKKFTKQLERVIQKSEKLKLSYSLNEPTETQETSAELKREIKLLVPQTRELATLHRDRSITSVIAKLIHEGFFNALGSAMFALLAFYIANAAYRSFRIRSIEAFVMMVAAVIVMLGQIPHGPLYVSESLPWIRRDLLLNVSVPAFRAIYFGSAIAGLALAVRMWLSLERSPLDEQEQPKRKAR